VQNANLACQREDEQAGADKGNPKQGLETSRISIISYASRRLGAEDHAITPESAYGQNSDGEGESATGGCDDVKPVQRSNWRAGSGNQRGARYQRSVADN